MAKKKEVAPSPAPGTPPAPFIDPRLPQDAQDKLAGIQKILEKFKDKLITKFEGYINGIALLPPPKKEEGQQSGQPQMPPMQQQPPQPENPNAIHVLVLVDDTDSKKMSKEELKHKLSGVIDEIAKEVDKNIEPQTVIYSELWQQCYDAKYDMLQMIAMSAPVYDLGMLSAIKIAEIHKNMVLQKFERYIVSYVLAGSLVQGKATPSSDIDVFIVIDDTDVKKMTRFELKDKLRAIIIGMGAEAGQMTGVQNKINIQVYILTDFWDSIKEANPVIFTFLRDGVPFYDRGIFMPWKQLLRMGKIRPSMEAIDLYMSSGSQVLDRVRLKLKEMAMEDFFYSILTPSQAVIMLHGVSPPTPKETPHVMRDIFVKKEKMLDEKYVKTLEKVIKLRKDLEHGSITKVDGKQIDGLLAECTDYLKRIDELAVEIEKGRNEHDVMQIYESATTLISDILLIHQVKVTKTTNVFDVFEKDIAKQQKIPKPIVTLAKKVEKAKKEYDDGKLSKAEIEKVRTKSQELLRFLMEYIQRAKAKDIERVRVRVRYNKKYGEVVVLGKDAFITFDLNAQEREVHKASLKKDGTLGAKKNSSFEELDDAIAKAQIDPDTFVPASFFGELPKLFGKDVEVLM